MKFQFLGGAGEIGRLGLQVQTDRSRLLFDYGYSVDDPIKFPMFPSKIDALFCSHAHLDHFGLAPMIHRVQPESKLYATHMTNEISKILLYDSIKVFEMNREPQLYTKTDVDRMNRSCNILRYGQTKTLHNLEIEVLNAGHVPGAAMFHVRGPGTNFLFTGDMNLQESNLTRGAAIPKHPVETLFIEGTYGNRHQPPREQVVQLMNEKIDEAISNKGKVIIPAFAFGRSQDLLMELVRGHQIYFDGLSNRILGCFLEQGREIIPRFEHLEQAAKRCVRVTTPKLRLRAMNEAQIIITTGGMLDGGPVISYLKQLWNDPRSKIFLSGYQGEGTNGERLEQHRQLILDGKLCQVACEVVDTKQSAHSDLGSLLTFVEKVQPRNLVIMHSEESEAFRQHLLDRFPTLNVIVPTIGTSYTLDGS